jgi:ring-1,2-phenylacetyl-CoA epoxidase subunit PaaE
MNRFSLSVIDIKKETSDSCTIFFKQPGLRKIKYLAGQYLTLILRIKGRLFYRPYSFSTAPAVDDFLGITVKRIKNGVVSNYINENLQIGDVVEVLEPMGDFVLNKLANPKNIFLWGVGSGITPLYSILKETLFKDPLSISKVHLVYGNKNQESSIFDEQLKSLHLKFPNIFKITNFYSDDNTIIDCDSSKKGRINSDFIIDVVSKDQLSESAHFICGPSSLKELIINTLNGLNIDYSSIFTEEFKLSINSKDLSSIQDSQVKLFFGGIYSSVSVLKGRTILDAALDSGIELPYSCQTGNCSTCKGVLKEGNLKMLGLNNKRGDLEQNEFLLCCSYPESKQVIIEVI